MNRLKEVTAALLRVLADEVPQVPDWQYAASGFNRSKSLEGTVSCDRVKFGRDYKGADEATAAYSIYILDPDSSGDIEDLAFKTRDALAADPDLDRWATDSLVTKILFGVAPGVKNAGLAVIEYEVKFDLKQTGESE